MKKIFFKGKGRVIINMETLLEISDPDFQRATFKHGGLQDYFNERRDELLSLINEKRWELASDDRVMEIVSIDLLEEVDVFINLKIGERFRQFSQLGVIDESIFMRTINEYCGTTGKVTLRAVKIEGGEGVGNIISLGDDCLVIRID